MRLLRILVLGFALYFSFGDVTPAFSAGCANPTSSPNADESITCSLSRPNTDVWRINQPFVKQSQTTYPDITFAKGDLVSVFAGGCVQTGGSGLTWKRYVKPVARDQTEDDQYFGQITIPGFGALRRIRDAVLAGGIAITSDPGPAPLTLGYVDNGYSDNGYWGRDDGWWEQCRDLSNAFVVIVIQHNCATSISPSCIHGRAVDKVVSRRDPNGFPINPQWVWTTLTGTAPNLSDVCSWSKKTLGFPRDDADLCSSGTIEKDISHFCDMKGVVEGRNPGHVNLVDEAVTYSGAISFDSANISVTEDDDYTFNINSIDTVSDPTPHTEITGALTVADQMQIPQAEFSAGETLNNFSAVGWWDGFNSAVQAGHGNEYFGDATEGIVIGLPGFDCAHDCNTEVHPAWALFVHTKNSLIDDTWEFFARNWGNEGFCGEQNHILSTTQLVVQLPRPNATAVVSLPTTIVKGVLAGPTDPAFSVVLDSQGGSADATIALPPPNAQGVVYGELHLQWTVPLSPFLIAQISTDLRAHGISEAEITAAVRSPSSQALADLQAQVRKRIARAAFTARLTDRDSIEAMVAGAIAAKPKAYQKAIRQRALLVKVYRPPVSSPRPPQLTIPQEILHPKGPVVIQATALPPNPKWDALRAEGVSLLPDAAPTQPHPELEDKLTQPH